MPKKFGGRKIAAGISDDPEIGKSLSDMPREEYEDTVRAYLRGDIGKLGRIQKQKLISRAASNLPQLADNFARGRRVVKVQRFD